MKGLRPVHLATVMAAASVVAASSAAGVPAAAADADSPDALGVVVYLSRCRHSKETENKTLCTWKLDAPWFGGPFGRSQAWVALEYMVLYEREYPLADDLDAKFVHVKIFSDGRSRSQSILRHSPLRFEH